MAAAESYIGDKVQMYISKVSLEGFELMTNEDIADFFKVFQDVKKELAYIKLENSSYEYFISNTPTIVGQDKILLSKRKRSIRFIESSVFPMSQEQERKESTYQGRSSKFAPSARIDSVLRPSMLRQSTILKPTSTALRDVGDGNVIKYELEKPLNFAIKSDLAVQMYSDINRKLQKQYDSAEKMVKRYYANEKELNIQIGELYDTLEMFYAFVEKEQKVWPYKLHAEKIRYFFKTWTQNGLSLLSTLKVKLDLVKRNILLNTTAIGKKEEYRNIVPADYALLEISRNKYKNILETKNVEVVETNKQHGKVGLAVIKQKNKCLQMENILKRIDKDLAINEKKIENLTKEIDNLENEIITNRSKLDEVKEKVKIFEAPTIKEYMDLKKDLQSLYDEEKVLNRKVYILKIQLQNAKKNVKKKH